MKKFLLAVAVIATTLCAQAQQAVGSFSVKPMAGINLATLTNTDGSSLRVGFTGGAELQYQFNGVLAFSGGLLYSQQGCKVDGDDADGSLRMDYVNVPLLANFYVAKGFALKLGLQPGFKVNSKIHASADGASADVDLEKALEAAGASSVSVPSVVLSIPVGFSYEYKNVVFDARYNWGVTNAVKAESESWKHSVFTFTLGYRFAL